MVKPYTIVYCCPHTHSHGWHAVMAAFYEFSAHALASWFPKAKHHHTPSQRTNHSLAVHHTTALTTIWPAVHHTPGGLVLHWLHSNGDLSFSHLSPNTTMPNNRRVYRADLARFGSGPLRVYGINGWRTITGDI